MGQGPRNTIRVFCSQKCMDGYHNHEFYARTYWNIELYPPRKIAEPDALEKAITPKTKLLILPYPNNPTGAIMEKPDLDAIAEVIARHDLLVISDEIYSELVYDGHKHVSFASVRNMYDRTITINGFSKAFAMTGWRVGYACGSADIISVMNKIHQYAIMCAPRQGQVAAAAALRHCADRHQATVDAPRMRRVPPRL